MPILIVRGADGIPKAKLRELRNELRYATYHFVPLDLNSVHDVEVYFERDLLGEQDEVSNEIKELWEKPERTKAAQDELCAKLNTVIRKYVPLKKRVFSFVDRFFDPDTQGHALDEGRRTGL